METGAPHSVHKNEQKIPYRGQRQQNGFLEVIMGD